MDDLKDVQNSTDNHIKIRIDYVGVNNIKKPIFVATREDTFIHSVGVFELYSDLPYDVKGTHMSRLITTLDKFQDERLTLDKLEEICDNILNKLEKATTATVTCEFPYFMSKTTPVSQIKCLMNYDAVFQVSKIRHKTAKKQICVSVPVTSLCPCSKEISDAGAHNQRSIVTIMVCVKNNAPILWIEELIELAEKSASCEVYSVLKRVDEKYVTEKAYNNPVFCEDIVRNIADDIYNCYTDKIEWFRVESSNMESIHNHNAYAMIQGAT
jgi:GTP cyclohydrolase I